MPRYYGIYLDVKDRLGIVFGGDAHEGQRKVNYLLECGANVKLFSPDDEISPALRAKADTGEIEWVNRKYQPSDLAGAWIVIVADTSSMETNEAISKEATERNILLNVMDVTPLCTWIAPSLIQRNEVTVAVSTAGSSPALARRIRERMSDEKNCQCLRWAGMGPLIADVRVEQRARDLKITPNEWAVSITDQMLDIFEGGDADKARAMLVSALETHNAASKV
ncbi:MAG TPA: bifunctional precorrin-2 dehydrogenase/sirohydrochlorin ferrochelatase [Dehalococcoidia bacterium]|nr:bifunctional precorrin-2 dehydrogenase/sirohydrochlorin ferrochelatase [Dehalococcoidia bacterium]MDP7262612.1 bifunctional precorrin-2 dehydrogenase/sirohydrochlorin ferrochelatase [Dehalococcoidia bacterium]HJP27514.1 bifunctional precorrin-2 dehydrogenase/sirohydrochlorin ferrochelatase [Dehalococcoidia bacterium]